MVKYKLDITEEIDYAIFGLVTHVKDYRLAWSLNQLLHLNLFKAELELTNWSAPADKRIGFPCFQYENAANGCTYFLINNKLGKLCLLPDLPQFDFIFMVKPVDSCNTGAYLESLKKIPQVLTAYAIDVKSTKYLDNLIFDE